MAAVEPVLGAVLTWDAEQGWGVIDSPETPGGCWCHFSAVAMPGYRALTPGTAVEFVFEQFEQDGYKFRVVETWLPGRRSSAPGADQESYAYRSTLQTELDD